MTIKASAWLDKSVELNEWSIAYADLFCGIGGFHLGLDALGMKCVFASEINANARKTYLHNFLPRSPEIFENNRFPSDITKIDIDTIPDFDVLTAGFPCQPFSNSGRKFGFEDTRGTLFFHIAEILNRKRPSAFFLENVKHLIHHDQGRTFKIIRSILTESLGYSFHWKIVHGTDYGVPQLRPRIYMVGFRDKGTPFEFPDPVPLKITLDDILGGKCDRKTAFTLRCGGRSSGIDDRRNWDTYLVDGATKTIGPEEGKLLQGFPTDFVFPVSDRQAMIQLGNSVTVPAVTEVGRALKRALIQRKSRFPVKSSKDIQLSLILV